MYHLKILQLIFVFSFLFYNAFPQSIISCVATEYEQILLQANPDMLIFKEQMESDIRGIMQSETFKNSQTGNGVYKIPIVIHLIGDNVITAITPTKVQTQLDILNNCYRKKAGTPGDGDGVDAQIEFCLATIDPDGLTTDGIIEIAGNYNSINYPDDDATIKGLSHWEPNEYLNVYVVDQISSSFGIVAGYSSFPMELQGAPNLDGVVVIDEVFGNGNTYTSRTQGKTLVHEIGHWLGLYHPFQNGANSNEPACQNDDCTQNGDLICDTPPQDGSTSGCPSGKNTCNTDAPDLEDAIRAYMDYTDDQCRDMFTFEQRERMHAFLNNTRSGLFLSEAACPTATHCSNGSQDSDEEGVDCGGIDCTPCFFGGGSGGGTGGGSDDPWQKTIFCNPRANYIFINGCLSTRDVDYADIIAENLIIAGGGHFDYQGGYINLIAGNAIILNPGFDVSPTERGHVVTMEIWTEKLPQGGLFNRCPRYNKFIRCPLFGKNEFLEDASVISDSIENLELVLTDNFLNTKNPFTTHTLFEYSLKENSTIMLTIQNLLGQTIATPISNETKEQGEHTFTFDASSLPAGIYFCTFEAKSEKGEVFRETKKLVKLK